MCELGLVDYGVSLVSILGPLVFILHVNYLPFTPKTL